MAFLKRANGETAGQIIELKPDRIIIAFIEDSIGRNMTVDEAVELIQSARRILSDKYPQLTPRFLEHEIWKHQRQK